MNEGELVIHLRIKGPEIHDVTISSTRPVHAARALVGRAANDVARLVPLLFPVCGVAQSVACSRALDASLDRAEDPEHERARELATLAEAVASHIWQLALTWREAAGAPAHPILVREARVAAERIRAALLIHREWDAVRREADRLAALVGQIEVEGNPLLEIVARSGHAALGWTASIATTRTLDPDEVGARLADDPTFAERPTQWGRPVDVSAHDAGPGATLLARLEARRDDAIACLERLRNLDVAPPSRVRTVVAGGGVGVAMTARGPLVHFARTRGDRVEDLRVVAPTEWTFHPAGILREALVGAKLGDDVERVARWMVIALDPCVPYRIEVGDA